MLSTGEAILAPKPHKQLLKRLRKFSRSLSRKEKGGQNRRKAKERLARLHARIRHIREDALHKAAHSLVESFGGIVIEDLSVAGMLRCHSLARSIADLGFAEFRRLLEYKTAQSGVVLIIANRWFASTKLCFHCGLEYSDLGRGERYWTCPHCQSFHDRDHNAAKNLELYFEFVSTVSSTGINAWGDDIGESWRKLVLSRASMNQEFDIKPGNRNE